MAKDMYLFEEGVLSDEILHVLHVMKQEIKAILPM